MEAIARPFAAAAPVMWAAAEIGIAVAVDSIAEATAAAAADLAVDRPRP